MTSASHRRGHGIFDAPSGRTGDNVLSLHNSSALLAPSGKRRTKRAVDGGFTSTQRGVKSEFFG